MYALQTSTFWGLVRLSHVYINGINLSVQLYSSNFKFSWVSSKTPLSVGLLQQSRVNFSEDVFLEVFSPHLKPFLTSTMNSLVFRGFVFLDSILWSRMNCCPKKSVEPIHPWSKVLDFVCIMKWWFWIPWIGWLSISYQSLIL